MPRLIVRSREEVVAQHELEKPVTHVGGSQDNDLVLLGAEVDATIELRGDGFLLRAPPEALAGVSLGRGVLLEPGKAVALGPYTVELTETASDMAEQIRRGQGPMIERAFRWAGAGVGLGLLALLVVMAVRACSG